MKNPRVSYIAPSETLEVPGWGVLHESVEPVRAFLLQIAGFLPRLALAIGVLIAGWLLAKFAMFAIVRGLRAINFNVLTERAGLDGFLRQGGVETDTTGILGLLVYWLVIVYPRG